MYDYEWVKGVIVYQFVIVAVESLVFFLLAKPKYHRIHAVVVGVFLIIEIAVQGNSYIKYHGLSDIDEEINWGLEEFEIQSNLVRQINEKDKSFFRMNSTKANEYHPNLGSAENYNGMSTFHTFYNTEVDDFVHMMALTNFEESWSALDFAKHAYLEEFLGVKYYMTQDSETSYYNADGSIFKTYEPNLPLNYELVIHSNGYRIYENKKQINLGFSYDTVYYKHRKENDKVHNAFYTSNWHGTNLLRNEEAMFMGVILNDEDIEEISKEYDGLNIVDGLPTLSASFLTTKVDANNQLPVYRSLDENNIAFNPADPTRDIKPENLIPRENLKDYDATSFQIVIEYKGDEFPIGSEGGYYMIDYPFARTGGSRCDAVLWAIDTDGQVITFDDGRYNSISYDGGHIYRGIYSKKPVKYFIICPMNSTDYLTSASVYYQPWEDVLANYDKALSNALENVVYDTNKATFMTNYEENRFVCTQLAYTRGWKLRASVNGVKKDLKVYNAQGGFVGFIAPKGTVTYELTYCTEDLGLWSLVSAGGILGITAVSVVPIIIKKKKEKQSSK